MSREYYARIEMERKRREALERKRAAEEAERLLSKYSSQMESMVSKGYRGYIPDEIARLERDIETARKHLIDDRPKEARSVCQRIGAYIGSLDVIADTAIAQFERSERLRSEQAKARSLSNGRTLMDAYFKGVATISDPIIANIAAPALDGIRRRIEELGDDSYTERSLQASMANIINSATADAEELRAADDERRQRACLASQIDDVDLLVRDTKIENADAAEEFSRRIAQLKRLMASDDYDKEELGEAIEALHDDYEVQAISEEIRRETVKAIYRQLKSQEFAVEKPKRFVVDGSDYVRIVARRPSGKRAICDIGTDGSIRYRFDKYEAMTCLKDIERFNVDLESIYSMKLSDERVIWSNPDRLTKDANRTENDDRRYL